MLLAIHHEFVNVSVQGSTYDSRRSGELDNRPTLRHTINLKALRREPAGNRLSVGIGEPESLSELLGREPVVIVGVLSVSLRDSS